MDLGLKNKVVIVSGASRGLGFATALSFAKEGAKVAICSRKKNHIEAAADKIQSQTHTEILAIPANMTDPKSIQDFVDKVGERWGAVHICITNTGGPPS